MRNEAASASKTPIKADYGVDKVALSIAFVWPRQESDAPRGGLAACSGSRFALDFRAGAMINEPIMMPGGKNGFVVFIFFA